MSSSRRQNCNTKVSEENSIFKDIKNTLNQKTFYFYCEAKNNAAVDYEWIESFSSFGSIFGQKAIFANV